MLGLSLVPVYRIEDALDLLNEGEYQRAYAEKKYHDHSSRSHTIFQIVNFDLFRKSCKTRVKSKQF